MPTVLAEFDWGALLNPAVLVFVVGGVAAVVAIVAANVASVMRARELNRLKLDMLDRGYSPQDIERVVRAGPIEQDRDDDGGAEVELSFGGRPADENGKGASTQRPTRPRADP